MQNSYILGCKCKLLGVNVLFRYLKTGISVTITYLDIYLFFSFY